MFLTSSKEEYPEFVASDGDGDVNMEEVGSVTATRPAVVNAVSMRSPRPTPDSIPTSRLSFSAIWTNLSLEPPELIVTATAEAAQTTGSILHHIKQESQLPSSSLSTGSLYLQDSQAVSASESGQTADSLLSQIGQGLQMHGHPQNNSGSHPSTFGHHQSVQLQPNTLQLLIRTQSTYHSLGPFPRNATLYANPKAVQIPAGTSYRALCRHYSNHLTGQVLLQMYQNGFDWKDVYEHMPENTKRDSTADIKALHGRIYHANGGTMQLWR